MFGGPERARCWIDRETLRVAMAETEDLRLLARPASERIVGGRRALFGQAQDLAAVTVQVLRPRTVAALANGHVEHAVGAERELRAEVRVARVAVVGDEDIPAVEERLAV